ncbi:MAG: hypothetical protein J6N52_14405 [Clostridia bacterium]|nr:hypothetical protein [Clostridia bacterium]
MENKFIEIIKKHLLTPVLYRLEDEYRIIVVGFFDLSTTVESIYEAQTELEKLMKKEIHILDIRDFCEAERLDFLKEAENIYSETPLVKSMFEAAMAEDFKDALDLKKDAMERSKNTGTIYLS